MEKNDELWLMQIKKYDFFGGNRETFFNKESIRSHLVQGCHRNPEPLVTIILMTYKRHDLLKFALDSALNQTGFSDYQILIADNEGEDLNRETDTSRLIKNYKNEKILYYRHEKSVTNKADFAISLAKSKWICILHDDDVLVANHLKAMTDIVNIRSDISFLACEMEKFYDEPKNEEYNQLIIEKEMINTKVECVPSGFASVSGWAGWLGALIDRENYINMGGMPTIPTGVSDFIMVVKYAHIYGMHKYITNTPLYRYRIWRGQASSLGNEQWLKGYISEFYFYKYIATKRYPFTKRFWIQFATYHMLSKIEESQKNYYNLKLQNEEWRNACNIAPQVATNGIKYIIVNKIAIISIGFKIFWANKIRNSNKNSRGIK